MSTSVMVLATGCRERPGSITIAGAASPLYLRHNRNFSFVRNRFHDRDGDSVGLVHNRVPDGAPRFMPMGLQ